MIQDLRQWLSEVDKLGELVCVAEPVDPVEEMGAVTYLVAKQSPSPAVVFEHPEGPNPLGARLLWNILGPSIRRIALTLEEPPETPALELIRRVKDKMQKRIPPEEIALVEAPSRAELRDRLRPIPNSSAPPPPSAQGYPLRDPKACRAFPTMPARAARPHDPCGLDSWTNPIARAMRPVPHAQD